MYAVICAPTDRSALWAVDRLRVRLGEVRLIPVDLLALTRDFRLSLGEEGATDGAAITLPDGTEFGTGTCAGVLNRAARSPWPAVRAADGAYAAEEMMAITLAFLAAFGPACVNRPDPAGLAGRDFGLQGWLHLAALAGLPTAPFALGAAPPRPLPPSVSQVLVIGDQVFGLAGAAADRARDLARLAGLSVMALSLDASGRVVGATAQPDLSLAGEAGADALAQLLGGAG